MRQKQYTSLVCASSQILLHYIASLGCGTVDHVAQLRQMKFIIQKEAENANAMKRHNIEMKERNTAVPSLNGFLIYSILDTQQFWSHQQTSIELYLYPEFLICVFLAPYFGCFAFIGAR